MFGDPVRNDKEWPTKPIKEVAPETNADIPKDNEYWWLNLDMIESYSGRLLDRVIEKSDAIGSSTHPFDDSMVLYSKLRPYLNKIFVPDSYGYATTELVALKPNPNELNKYFLFNLLRGDCFVNFANKSSSGAQMPRMQMKVLREFQCILPPMDLQNKFVEISEQADKSKFTGFKSQFIEMFGNLPENFKHETVELGKIADMFSGGTPSSKHPEYYGDKYPFVTTPCLGKNYISETDAVNWLSELGVEKSSTHIIPAYSVMYGSRVGVGKSSINTCEMCTNQDILSFFNIDTEKYDLLFIKKVMDQYFDYIVIQKRGSTIKGVPSDIVKALKIPMVPIDEQKMFAAFTEQSDKSK